MQDLTLLIGDCRTRLADLPDKSVQMCVTSPPYFGLRNYGHDAQIGLEDNPDAFVAELVSVFREVRRVLADDGVLWLNLGDSYSGSRAGEQGVGGQMANRSVASARCRVRSETQRSQLPYKNLIGIPWRVAFALQADGWILRQDIIWHKPNPMPESVTDRCTKAHEYIFLLSKSPKYFFNSESMQEASAPSSVIRAKHNGGAVNPKNAEGVAAGVWCGEKSTAKAYGQGRNKRSVWTVSTKPFKGAHFAVFPPDLILPCILAGSRPGDMVLDPFGGSGTTAEVAILHGRKAVLVELNPEYAPLIEERCANARQRLANPIAKKPTKVKANKANPSVPTWAQIPLF